ncbi:TadE/TadG family type IV pilus assembly protein [Aurantiacibacter rhizosphaerae]|uniref:Pilus assembly protein TadE n=1 Tax=Aurantiacibacter rhizosphaerae TaxID=2691582 RepID=A0A844XD15_9SPHN|nr:TadE family protein [Aurantiacibacter rhizosphaerae]MWV28431.1 pilus assembly protein TadE [Aurantiacibacter rhizosphaerae]
MARDENGAVLIEAAFVLPIVIILLLGAVSYGMWFMAAHSLQQAANEGARAVLAGIDAEDRAAIVQDVVRDGVLSAGTVEAEHVSISTTQEGNSYTVAVSYDTTDTLLLSSSIIPLPPGPITRKARVHLSSM